MVIIISIFSFILNNPPNILSCNDFVNNDSFSMTDLKIPIDTQVDIKNENMTKFLFFLNKG